MKIFTYVLFLAYAEIAESNHAILAVGSRGIGNYRHQADACHAYQVLLELNFQSDRIFMLSVDDVVNSPLNPNPGQLFNDPNLTDVYSRCRIDYRGDSATLANFELLIKRLSSNASSPPLVKESLPFLFIYFVDHGGHDILAFPDGFLTGERLRKLFLLARRKFRVLCFVEACESGSLFSVPPPRGVLAVTAANKSEPSFGIFCDSGLCLADDFSASWISALEQPRNESLDIFVKNIQANTELSEVSVFGDKTMLKVGVLEVFR